MPWTPSRFVPRSAPAVLLILTLAAAAAFAAVSHLVTRFNANQQSRARRLYSQGIADVNAMLNAFNIASRMGAARL